MKRIKKNAFKIPGKSIRKFLEINEISQKELADWINVNPASLTRWKDETESSPTSTATLILIPLLLAAGIDDFIPAPTDKQIAEEFASLRGLVSEDQIRKDPKKFSLFKKRVALKHTPEVKKAKELFERLEGAWDLISGGKTIAP